MSAISWNALDWALGAIVAFCVLRGVWKGAVSQIFGIAAVLCGFILAAHFHEMVAVPFREVFPRFPKPNLATFLLIFLLAWFCIGGAGYWLSSFLHRKGLGFVDRFVGLALGLLKAVVFSAIVVSVLTFFLPPKSVLLKESFLTRYVQVSAALLIKATPRRVQEGFEKRVNELKRSWSTRIEVGSDRSKDLIHLPLWK